MSLYDENDSVLRDIASKGHDLERPRSVDFAHLFRDQSSAQSFADEARREGLEVKVSAYDSKEEPWDATASMIMVPTCENITRMEELLDSLARKYGGHADGWGFLDP